MCAHSLLFVFPRSTKSTSALSSKNGQRERAWKRTAGEKNNGEWGEGSSSNLGRTFVKGFKRGLFVCFFVDRPMWGFTIPSQIAWIQKTCSALSLLSPPWPGIHSPWLDASLLLGARVSWEMNLELDKTLSRDEVLWHQQMIFEESPLHS